MAKSTKQALSLDTLFLEGVQVTMTIRVGDWHRYIAISPVDYEVFKRWGEMYGQRVIDAFVRDIEGAINAKDKN